MKTNTPWFTAPDAPKGLPVVRAGRPYVKMQGLRNDFVIVDGRAEPYDPSAEEIIRICDRHEGVGADELLIVNPPETPGTYARVRIINPDGREVEACGNASRCVGWLLMAESGLSELKFETLGGVLTCARADETPRPATALHQVSVEMGKIRTRWDQIPLAREMDTLHLPVTQGPLSDPVGMNIGNPHAVFFVEDTEAIDLPAHGRAIQTHPLFPEETNVGVAQMMDETTMRLEVWERPGNMTTACGTGACVAVAAARRRGLTQADKVRVLMPAGEVTIELKNGDTAIMTGPAQLCHVGHLLDIEK